MLLVFHIKTADFFQMSIDKTNAYYFIRVLCMYSTFCRITHIVETKIWARVYLCLLSAGYKNERKN